MIESSSYRVLVLEPSAKVRRDYEALLTPSLSEEVGVGADVLDALVAGVMAPPPGFPAVDLALCRKPGEALRLVEEAKTQLRPFAVAFVEPGGGPDAAAIIEQLREKDESLNIVIVTADLQTHPRDLAERAPPLDQLYFLSKPFHAFEIQQMVVSLGARWVSERSDSLPAGDGARPLDGGEPTFARPWEHLPASLVLFDRRDRLVSTNAAARETFPELAPVFAAGTPYETFQREFARRLLPEDTLVREEVWMRDRLEWHAKSGRVIDQRLRNQRWVVMTESTGPAGETYCLIVDISPLKRRDHSRDVARRMAQIGDGLEAFCGELLKALGLSASVKAGSAPASDFERLMIALTRSSAKTLDRRRATHLLDNLRRLIAPERLQIEATNLNDLVSSSPDLSQSGDSQVQLRVVAGAGLWPVDCDKARLGECLRELVANAVAAGDGSDMPVTIETRNLRVTREFAATRPALTQGDYVRLSVRDQGPGMSSEVAERAMIPFFRSGSRSLGMGLGLSAVFVTISRLGGHMEIESALDRGTTVHLYLPRSASSAPGKRGKQDAS